MGLFALELDSGGSELEEISLELDEDLAVLELLDGLFSLLEDDGSVDDELLMKKKMSVLFEWKKERAYQPYLPDALEPSEPGRDYSRW